MHFFTTLVLSTLAAMATAQNPFTRPTYTGITAGTQTNITWSPTTSGTVTLKLVQGDPSALTTVSTVASAIPNNGFYLWTPATSIVAASNYALEIISDSNTNIMNWTPQFAIASSTTSSASGNSTTSAASTTTGSPFSNSSTTTKGATSTTGSMTTKTTATGAAASSTAATVSKNAAAVVSAEIGVTFLGLVGAFMMAL